MTGKTLRGSTATRDLGLLRRNLKVTTGEIADLAGKNPSAVSHWRKGKRGFPEPVVGGRSPLFRYDEVHNWLEHHDKLAHEPDAVWLWRKSVQALHESTGMSERSRLRGYVTAMVVVLPDFLGDLADFVELLETGGFDQWLAETDRDLDTDLVEFLREHLTDVEPDREILRCAARAFRYALDNHYTDFILLDEALDALNVLSPVQTTTSEEVVGLISELIGNLCDHGGTVADLACGEATLLTSLLEQDSDMADAMALDGGEGWGPDGGDLDLQKLSDSRFLGVEIDRDTAAIAHIRLMLNSSPATADWHIQVGNSLAVAHEPAERFDTVIVDPPTTKTKAWLNLASKSLTTNPASRAFVLLPSSALVADGPCASLLRERRLEAIIHLPNRLKKDSRGLVLCLITGESTSCTEILHINLADLKIRNPYYGPVIPLLGLSAGSLPYALAFGDSAGDVCAAISHWRTTGTINGELLYGRQGSITADEAVERGLTQVVSETLFSGKPNFHVALDALSDIERELTPHPEEVESDPWNLWDLSEEQIQQALLAVVALLVRSSTDKLPIAKQELERVWNNLFEDDPAKQAQLANDPKLMVRVWRDLISANRSIRSMRTTPADPIPFGPLAELSHGNFPGVALRETNLGGANLSFANLKRAFLFGANLVGANLVGANLVGANLVGANLESADLVGANLIGANLNEARLVGADLSNADLSWAELARTRLAKASLVGANLIGANLIQARLVGTDLSNADLSSANLYHADLYQANLQGADLVGTNLSRANLSGADLYQTAPVRANFVGATASPLTRWPDGFNPAVAKVIFEN